MSRILNSDPPRAVALAAALVFLGLAVAPVAGSALQSSEIPPDVEFGDDSYVVADGDTEAITVDLDGGEEGYVTLDGQNYSATVRVADPGPFEDQITIEYDTALAGSDAGDDLITAYGVENATVVNESGDSLGAEDEVVLRAYPGDPSETNATDRSRLDVVPDSRPEPEQIAFENLGTAPHDEFYGESIEVTGLEGDSQGRISLYQQPADGDDPPKRVLRYNVETTGTEQADGTYAIELDTRDIFEHRRVDTSTEFFVRDDGRSDAITSANFTIEPVDVGFAWEDDRVHRGETVDLNFEDDERATPTDVTVTADGLSQDELVGLWSEAEKHPTDDDAALLVDVTQGQSLTADFSGVDTGTYTFTFEDEAIGASDEASIEVDEAIDEDVEFVDGTFAEEEGDWAQIQLDATNVDEAWVNMTASDRTWSVHLSGIDQADDESLVLEWNTFRVGAGDEQFRVSGDADVESVGFASGSEPPVGESTRLQHGLSFILRAYPEDPTQSSTTDRTRLDITERSTDDVTTYVAPAGLTDDWSPEDHDAVETLLDESSPADTVAEGDYLVTQVEASGIYGYLGDESNFDPDGQGISLEYGLSDPGPFDDGNGMQLSSFASDDVHLVTDEEEDQFFVVLDVSSTDDFFQDTSYDATFSVSAADSVYLDEDADDEEVSSSFTVEERSVELVGDYNDDDQLRVSNTDDAEIVAETNVAPGTQAEIFVELQDEIVSETPEVDEDGEVVASFDFGDREAGEVVPTIEALVEGPTDETDDVEGIFADAETSTSPIPLVEYEAQPLDGSDLYWDVNGDGDLTTEDVSVFQEYLFSDSVQNNPEVFNFSGSADGSVSHGDVVALFLEATGLA